MGNHHLTGRDRRNSLGAPTGPTRVFSLLVHVTRHTSHVMLSNGMLIPANTNAMVSMQVITHDSYPHEFKATKILVADVDLRGRGLQHGPLSSARRVCPSKNLGLATVSTRFGASTDHKFQMGSSPS